MGRERSKRYYDHRSLAFEALGIAETEVAAAPQITAELAAIEKTLKGAGQPVTRRQRTVQHPHDSTERITITDTSSLDRGLPAGPGSDLRTAWPSYLQTSDHADARKVLLAYRSVPHLYRRVCPIEAYCVAVHVSPLSILSILVGELVRSGVTARTVISMVNQPRVTQKMVDMALTDEGFADRELLAKATGFLPAAKGAQTIVNVAANASATADAKSIAAAPPEQTIRRLVDRFNEATRTLDSMPAASALPAAPSPVPSAAQPTPLAIDIPLYDDDEDDDDER